MIRITVDADRIPDAGRVISAELSRAVTLSVGLLEGDIASAVRKGVSRGATGSAARSVVGEVRGGAGVSLQMGGPIGVVGSPLPHLQVLNDGRRPGQRMPPVAAIEIWVRRAGIADLPESMGVAYVIARSIARKGIAPRRFFEDARARNLGAIEQIFSEAGHRIAVELTS